VTTTRKPRTDGWDCCQSALSLRRAVSRAIAAAGYEVRLYVVAEQLQEAVEAFDAAHQSPPAKIVSSQTLEAMVAAIDTLGDRVADGLELRRAVGNAAARSCAIDAALGAAVEAFDAAQMSPPVQPLTGEGSGHPGGDHTTSPIPTIIRRLATIADRYTTPDQAADRATILAAMVLLDHAGVLARDIAPHP
jgi:hypothetical protein